ncbi:MAG: universal stress protein [Caldilineaceae bacterium]|nr:universal stress protein [Caldilineaceae bacterium]MBP8109497.1 universal stress protein [Caldilineaceae bacterium]MBP8124308.1 universal stress protein [Caldilineaceae bacterium]MBP9074113.1 universal stress protein [Caldilineaceae bacterium]
MYKHILVPLDGSALAERALTHAAAIAHKFGSEITLVQVIPPIYAPVTPEMAVIQPIVPIEELQQESEKYLQVRQNELRGEGLVVHRTVIDGPIAESLLGYAEGQECGLIVMSTHGRSGFSKWIYGSVAQKMLQAATCPILLVRAVE